MDALPQNLRDTIARLRTRIEQFRGRGESIGEQNTKAVLIDPLLSALGWNLQELGEVRREYKYKPQDSPVDYALFILRTPRLFIEAKDLSADPHDRKWISQVLGYATVVGVEWCVLTNGDEYRLYNAHAAVDVDQKLFRSVRISDPTSTEYTLDTLYLLSKDKMGEKLIDVLWRSHFIDHHVGQVFRRLVSTPDPRLVRLIRKGRPELSPAEIRDSLKRADVEISFPAVPTFEPTPNEEPEKPRPVKPHSGPTPQVSDLIEAGLISPPLELEKRYKGHLLRATILQDGRVMFGGQAYNSLSTAAGMARKTIVGDSPGHPYPPTNGWTFWGFRDAKTGELTVIDSLRQAYLSRGA